MAYEIDRKAKYVPAPGTKFIMKKQSTPVSVTAIITPKNKNKQLLFQYSELFLICKITGLYAFNLRLFRQQLKFKRSWFSVLYVLFVMIIVATCFIALVLYLETLRDKIYGSKSNSTLTAIISMFLSYISLFMMAVDQINGLLNLSEMRPLYARFNAVDVSLNRENICITNENVSKRIRSLLILTVMFEISVSLTSIFLLHDQFQWVHILWISFSLPTLLNSFDKIWFATSLWALKMRFQLLNQSIEALTDLHRRYKLWRASVFDRDFSMQPKTSGLNTVPSSAHYLNMDFDFLRKKLNSQRIFLRNRISPGLIWDTRNILNMKTKALSFNNWNGNVAFDANLKNMDALEEKLNNYCQIHDELCEIGRLINKIWNYPILILMAYGFLMFTSQLYFYYCATQDQNIPPLFRSAYSSIVTSLILTYSGSKCVYMIYISWQTSQECKRTGVCLHKWGVAADNKTIYHIINHLSLKLLNHSTEFTACGFFSLDMETLFAVTGGITSYLIILIQFNLAALQAKVYFANNAIADANHTMMDRFKIENNTIYSTTETSTDLIQ